MRRVNDAAGESLEPAVWEMVEPGSAVRTDGWGGYNGLTELGYKHLPSVPAEPIQPRGPLPSRGIDSRFCLDPVPSELAPRWRYGDGFENSALPQPGTFGSIQIVSKASACEIKLIKPTTGSLSSPRPPPPPEEIRGPEAAIRAPAFRFRMAWGPCALDSRPAPSPGPRSVALI